MKRFLISISLVILLVSFLLPSSAVMAQPAPPQVFYGSATLDGAPAPNGASVTAEMAPYGVVGSATVSSGSYVLEAIGQSGDNGKTINFFINGLSAGSSTFNWGAPTPLNLSATSPPPQYTLTIDINGDGNASGAGTYNAGTIVPISATPAAGWSFVNWTGDAVADPNSANTTITMDANKAITANFSQLPTVTLTIAVTGNGTTDPPVGSYNYPEGTVVNITATPASGWQFVNWTGDVANPNSASTTVTMNTNKTVTANFSEIGVTYYTLTMAVTGNGSTNPAVGSHTYPAGTVVNITATPASGWQFDSWTGDVASPNSASTTVTMNTNKTVTANFSEIPVTYYTLTMAVNGNGTTSPSVGAHTYAEGTVVNISATPASGWQFVNWTGDVASPNSASTTVTMSTNKTVTANFSLPLDIIPPVISGTSASNVTRTSADISWTTDEAGDSQVEYWASPGTLTPLDRTLVTQHLVHLAELNPNTTYHYKVMSRDEAGNLAVSGELTITTLATPATFATGDWDISLTKVDAGKQVTISFLVTNTGELAGSYKATLAVNGVAEATKELTLDAGASGEITFTTTKGVAGSYLVTINGLSFSFEVEEAVPPPPPPPTKGPNWWLILGIIAGGALLVIYIILLARRGKLRAITWPVPVMRAKPSRDIAQSLLLAKRDVKAAEERVRLEAKERARQEAVERKAEEAEEKARIAAAEAREKWARMEAEAKVRKEAGKEAEKARPAEVEKLAGILTVTALAAEKLKDAIRAQTQDPETGFRLTRSPEKPNQLKMTLDKAQKEDHVVESGGVKILIISPELAPSLEELVIDYQETSQGAGFTISKRSPGKK